MATPLADPITAEPVAPLPLPYVPKWQPAGNRPVERRTRVAVIGACADRLALVRAELGHAGYAVPTHIGWTGAPEFVSATCPDAVVLELVTVRDRAGWKILDAMVRADDWRACPVVVWTDGLPAEPRQDRVLAEYGVHLLPRHSPPLAVVAAVHAMLGTPVPDVCADGRAAAQAARGGSCIRPARAARASETATGLAPKTAPGDR